MSIESSFFLAPDLRGCAPLALIASLSISTIFRSKGALSMSGLIGIRTRKSSPPPGPSTDGTKEGESPTRLTVGDIRPKPRAG